MKKFIFELQDVLEFRKFEEEQAQAELGKALAVENEINSNLQQIAMQYASLKNQMKGSRNFEDIMSQSKYTNLLNYQKEELLKQLAEAKLVSEEKRKILQEIMQKTTALEKLKEKQLDEYRAAADFEESEMMDDLATQKGAVQV